MTDFRVDDRVSVMGCIKARVDDQPGVFYVKTRRNYVILADGDEMTLIERPRKKLRVGSVWECNGATRYVYLGNDRFYDGLPEPSTFPRDQLTIDTSPQVWREVPVEELEREAGS